MARRVNTKFLIILTSILAVLVVATIVAQKLLTKDDPAEFAAKAKAAGAEGKIAEGARYFGHALNVDPENTDMLVQVGDYYAEYAWFDPEYILRARAFWEKALEVNPSYVPALERILNFWEQQSEISQSGELFERMREAARKLSEASPDNTHARALYHVAVIRAWLAGIATDRETVDENLAKIEELRKEDPANADLPTYLAQAKMARAQEDMRMNNRVAAVAQLDEAEKLMEDALAAQPDNASMNYKTHQVLTTLAALNRDPKNPDMYKTRYLPRIKSTLDKAVELSKPEDDDFVDIHLRAAIFAAQEKNAEEADKIYKALAESRPNDQIVRLAYAKQLSTTGHRKEAIELLSKPIEQSKSLKGVRAALIRQLRLQTLLDLTNMRLDEYAQTDDPAERERIMTQAEEEYAMIVAEISDGPESLKLKGKMQLFKGENIEAIQSLDRARALLEQQGRPKDFDLMLMLAKGYLATSQTGAAKTLLTEISKEYPDFILAKILLAQAMIRDQDLDGAKPYVDELEAKLPDQTEVIKMRLAMLDKKSDKAEIDRYYKKLPEETRDQRVAKAQIAAMVSNLNEAVRLLSIVLQDDPGDVQAAMALAQVRTARNEKSEAKEIINQALKQKPDDKTLQLYKMQLDGATQEEIAGTVEEMIDESADPFQKELQLAQLAVRQGKRDEYFTHVKKAESLKPDDTRVAQMLFEYYLVDKKWAEATSYVDKLSRANADSANGLLFKYRLASAKGELDAAVNIARDLTRSMPEFSRSWSTLGQALMATRQPQEALQRFALALEKQPTNIDALKGIISAYYQVERPEEALTYINVGREKYPADPEFQRFDVEHKLNYGDPKEAIAPLEEALLKKSNSPPAYAAVGNAYLKVARKVAEENPQESAMFLQKARDTFSQARQKWPGEPVFYGYLAEISLMSGDYEGGQKVLQQLRARPEWKDRVEPLMALANYYRTAGKFEEAEAVLREALDKPEDKAAVQSELASVLSSPNVRKYDEAIKVLDADPNNPQLQRQRIEILLTAGRNDDAEKAIRSALEKNPDSTDMLNLLAIASLTSRKYDQAATTLKKVLEIDPKNFTALYHFGLVRMQQPQPDLEESIKYLQQARDINVRNVEIRMTLAQAYRQRNDLDSAVNEIQAILDLVPANAQARLTLLELYSAYTPPRWSDYERTIKDALAIRQFANDPEWYQRESTMWLRRNDNAQAVAKMQEAVKLAPDNPAILNSYLMTLAETDNYNPLLRETERLLSKNLKTWWVYNARAVAKANLNDRQGALADFSTGLDIARNEGNDGASETIIRSMTKEIGYTDAIAYVLKLAESDPRWRLLLVSLYRSNQDDASAIAQLELLRADFSRLDTAQQLNALRLEGTVYLTVKPPQVEKSEKAYRELLKINPDDLTSLNNLACLLAESTTPPRPQEALEYSQRAYDLMTRRGQLEPLLADTHGWVLTLLGRPEGVNILETVVQRSPFLDAHYHLAEAYLKQQYPEEAQRQLVRAEELIAEASRKQEPVDPAIVAKVNDAMVRVQEAIRAKTQAQAP
jgi:tetratricopeptide (TPR) repeat protein